MSLVSQVNYCLYDSAQNGNIVAVKEWKYIDSAGIFGANPDRESDITYLTTPSSYTAINAIGLPITTTTKDGAGNTVAQTSITYDGGSLASVTGAFQHDDTNFGTAYTTRGNPTTISRLVSVGTNLSTSLSYDT